MVGKNYQLNDIHFAHASYELTARSKFIIEEFSSFLKKNATIKIEIQGHTDSSGNDRDNLILSQNRAKAVYDYMIELGINPSNLKYNGYGETKPRESNDTEWGRAQNRRTEFVVLSK